MTDEFNKINMAVGSDKSKTTEVNFIEIPLEVRIWNVMAHAQKPDFVFRQTEESI